MEPAVIAILSLVAIPVIRQAIKSYRLRKSVADIAVDAVEAAVDVIDKK